MTHTPGPWKDRVATGMPDHMISGSREGVCVIPFKYGEGSGTARRNANARLIAAAPELLAWLEAFCAMWRCGVRNTDNIEAAVTDARALLARISDDHDCGPGCDCENNVR